VSAIAWPKHLALAPELDEHRMARWRLGQIAIGVSEATIDRVGERAGFWVIMPEPEQEQEEVK
jgi:hypothetical protein